MNINEYLNRINEIFIQAQDYSIDNNDDDILLFRNSSALRNRGFISYVETQPYHFWVNTDYLNNKFLDEYNANPEIFWNYIVEALNSVFEEGEELTSYGGVPYQYGDIAVISNNNTYIMLYNYCNCKNSSIKKICYAGSMYFNNSDIKTGFFHMEDNNQK